MILLMFRPAPDPLRRFFMSSGRAPLRAVRTAARVRRAAASGARAPPRKSSRFFLPPDPPDYSRGTRAPFPLLILQSPPGALDSRPPAIRILITALRISAPSASRPGALFLFCQTQPGHLCKLSPSSPTCKPLHRLASSVPRSGSSPNFPHDNHTFVDPSRKRRKPGSVTLPGFSPGRSGGIRTRGLLVPNRSASS